MMCQHCNKNEAQNSFVLHMMGVEHEVHLCNECTEKFRQYAYNMHQQYAQNQQAGWWNASVQAKQRALGDNPFPYDAGDDVKNRRRLNALRGKMKEAIEQEAYEEAARLRDEIYRIEKEVYVYE